MLTRQASNRHNDILTAGAGGDDHRPAGSVGLGPILCMDPVLEGGLPRAARQAMSGRVRLPFCVLRTHTDSV